MSAYTTGHKSAVNAMGVYADRTHNHPVGLIGTIRCRELKPRQRSLQEQSGLQRALVAREAADDLDAERETCAIRKARDVDAGWSQQRP